MNTLVITKLKNGNYSLTFNGTRELSQLYFDGEQPKVLDESQGIYTIAKYPKKIQKKRFSEGEGSYYLKKDLSSPISLPKRLSARDMRRVCEVLPYIEYYYNWYINPLDDIKVSVIKMSLTKDGYPVLDGFDNFPKRGEDL